ncbi:N-acetylmuramoyl-L-alanine amidase [Candidatus Pacearchaeota archaeon]|nr:N-acetylmuramoyl-L-alanine amidase [Candidatus Pacearchaeota archaeon]
MVKINKVGKNNNLGVIKSGVSLKVVLLISLGLVLMILLVSIISAAYSRTSTQYSRPTSFDYFARSGVDAFTTFSQEKCEAGQDFVLQIAPASCTPAVVRSDLLEERNVPVFCPIMATKINPLIDVNSIDHISFKGNYPREISGVGFHPAQAALSPGVNLINTPVDDNIGYAVIILKQQPNESAMPDYVQGELTAFLRYDIQNAFGIGKADFSLSELSDLDWEQNYAQYGFWSGRGFVRAESIREDGAVIAVYSDKENRIGTFTLRKGQTSSKIYMPGFYCLAGLQVRLDGFVDPKEMAKFSIGGDSMQVMKGDKFLDNRCTLLKAINRGLDQVVEVSCKEDDSISEKFMLSKRAKISLEVNGKPAEDYNVGDRIYTDNKDTNIFIAAAYIKGDTGKENDLNVIFLSAPQIHSDKLSESDMERIYKLARQWEITNPNTLLSTIGEARTKFSAFIKSSAGYIVEGEVVNSLTAKDPTNNLFPGLAARLVGDQSAGLIVTLKGFAEPRDIEIQDANAKIYFENALENYRILKTQFAGEKVIFENRELPETYAERGLYEAILMAHFANQKSKMVELAKEFIELYPESSNLGGSVQDVLNNLEKLSNQEPVTQTVYVGGRIRMIEFEGVSEPKFKDYGVEVQISGAADANYNGRKPVTQNQKVFLSDKGEYIELKDLEADSATFDVYVKRKLTDNIFGSETIKVKEGDYKIIGEQEYRIAVNKINLNQFAKVHVMPSIDNAGTEANFTFKIGIEKRAIQLSPDKIKEKIASLDKQIEKWEKINDNIGSLLKGFKGACLGVGAYLTVKNYFANFGGKGIARHDIMKNIWYPKCSGEIGQGRQFQTMDQCLTHYSSEVDKDVELRYKAIQNVQGVLQPLDKDPDNSEIKLGTRIVNTEQVRNQYLNILNPKVQDYISSNNNLNTEFSSNNVNKYLDKVPLNTLRDIHTDMETLNQQGITNEMKDAVGRRLNENLIEIKNTYEREVQQENFLGSLEDTQKTESLGLVKYNKKIDRYYYSNGQTIAEGFGNIPKDRQIQAVDYNNKFYVLGLKQQVASGGIVYTVSEIYDEGGTPLARRDSAPDSPPGNWIIGLRNMDEAGIIEQDINKIGEMTFSSIQEEDCTKNGFSNAEVMYYETEPYKGKAAIVPFDLVNGWYAATKQTVQGFGSTASYDESGAVRSFYLCNVGANGRQDFFDGIRDDICHGINMVTGASYDQVSCLKPAEARRKISSAIRALETAENQYRAGIDYIRIPGVAEPIRVGNPAAGVPEMQCQEFMSPKDCKLLFNVCDPVICPSSRCNLGGSYTVPDVVQSGIVGSIALCLPNRKEGIAVPVCLTGIHAGLDNFVSIMKSYKGCLQENLETGKTVGICDEIQSIYMCEFFWRQAVPFTKLIIPKIFEAVAGQNVRGGGEYLGVANAWQNAQNSVSYFTQYYAKNSINAFKARSTEEAGTEVCKTFISARYPASGEFLDKLLEPDSPVQFYARFEEIPFTTATVPATSQYKVFFHIYAGNDRGAYFRVYLRNPEGLSLYQVNPTYSVANGYIPKGDTGSETVDFIASTGYKELCVSVNAKTECGFKQVTTSFALDYLAESYQKEQATKKDVKTEAECVSGSPSLYSMINPNIQAGAEEFINPELYNSGIIRICATANPGTRVGNEQRWTDVGYCDNQKLRCWLDQNSVKNSMEILEGKTLGDLNKYNLNRLMNEGKYLNNEQYTGVREALIKLVGTSPDLNDAEVVNQNALLHALESIDLNYTKVFYSFQKAELTWFRARVYNALIRNVIWLERERQSSQIADVISQIEGSSEFVLEQQSGEVLIKDIKENEPFLLDILQPSSGTMSVITIKAVKIENDKLTLELYPLINGIFELQKGISQKFDVDNDVDNNNVEDISITFIGLNNDGTAKIRIEEVKSVDSDKKLLAYNQGDCNNNGDCEAELVCKFGGGFFGFLKFVNDYCCYSDQTIQDEGCYPAKRGGGDPSMGNKDDDSSTTGTTTSSLAGKIIVLDPGHGGKGTGTSGNGIDEAELVWDIASRLKGELENKGAIVYLTKKVLSDDPIKSARTAIANQKNANVFISIHANSFGDPKDENFIKDSEANGAEVYLFCFGKQGDTKGVIDYVSNPDKDDECKKNAGEDGRAGFDVSFNLARLMLEAVSSINIATTRGVKGADMTVLQTATMPAVLVEVGFISNSQDAAILKKSASKQLLAEEIAIGLEQYFK